MAIIYNDWHNNLGLLLLQVWYNISRPVDVSIDIAFEEMLDGRIDIEFKDKTS